MEYKAKDTFEKIIEVKRVIKKITGGNKLTMTALVLVGDKNGKFGFALGKGLSVPQAVQRAVAKAKKNMIQLKIVDDTIPHGVNYKYKASSVLIKPAVKGSGIVAGGVAREIFQIAGLQNVSAKMLGSSNKLSNIHCVANALKSLK